MDRRLTSLLTVLMGTTVALQSSAQSAQRHAPETRGTNCSASPQWFYVSSPPNNQVLRYHEDTGELLGPMEVAVPGPAASCIAENGDYYVAAQGTREVLRFDGLTNEFLGAIVKAGSGGLNEPTAPVVTPDGKYILVGDLTLNGYLRYDAKTGEFINIFADPSNSPIDGAFMPTFSPYPEFATQVYVASSNTNSIQAYDIETGTYLGDFVPPGSGGLLNPIGTSFGPDGDFYVSSSGNSSVKRYDGRTGEYVGDHVPSGLGGLNFPRAIAFGGRNGDLYVCSTDSNEVLKFDRATGAFLGVAASGAELQKPRGLVFTARPNFYVEASPSVIDQRGDAEPYTDVKVEFVQLYDVTDPSPKIELVSIESNKPARRGFKDVVGATFGKNDTEFRLANCNDGEADTIYTITYRATNARGGTVLATTTVTVSLKDD
jgi:DNA-binding beta-propeller fold protein YncE